MNTCMTLHRIAISALLPRIHGSKLIRVAMTDLPRGKQEGSLEVRGRRRWMSRAKSGSIGMDGMRAEGGRRDASVLVNIQRNNAGVVWTTKIIADCEPDIPL